LHSTLLLAIAIAYIPQIIRIINYKSTQGISPLFLLFGAMGCNLQLANTLLLAAYAWPTNSKKGNVLELIHSGRLKGFKALGAVLGIVHVTLHWGFSIILFVYPY
jgi:uncharacterized protein with PQ loop repeat